MYRFVLIGLLSLTSLQCVNSAALCTDAGLWVDGHISCKYLLEPSGFNIHKDTKGFCKKFFDKCCVTCTRLEQEGHPTTTTTTRFVPSIVTAVHKGQSSVTNAASCTDAGLWVDGHISCKYLLEPSGFNIHKDTVGFCKKYFNKCCITCTKLEKINFGRPMTTTTTVPTTSTTEVTTPSTSSKPANYKGFTSLIFGRIKNLLDKLEKSAKNGGDNL